jgi:hypothetical protein
MAFDLQSEGVHPGVIMRNALHRAILRRFALRAGALLAFALAFVAMVAPAAWLPGSDPTLMRAIAVLMAFALGVPAVALSMPRRARTRATAPRALTSQA